MFSFWITVENSEWTRAKFHWWAFHSKTRVSTWTQCTGLLLVIAHCIQFCIVFFLVSSTQGTLFPELHSLLDLEQHVQWCRFPSWLKFQVRKTCSVTELCLSVPVSVSKDQQIKQLELELDQERRMAESLVEDMVSYYNNKHNKKISYNSAFKI